MLLQRDIVINYMDMLPIIMLLNIYWDKIIIIILRFSINKLSLLNLTRINGCIDKKIMKILRISLDLKKGLLYPYLVPIKMEKELGSIYRY